MHPPVAPGEAPDLSILIIARDAAAHLTRLLPALAPLRREVAVEVVVVVDDRTVDDTAEIAARHGARVVVGRFGGFGAFKEHGRRLCRGRWLLNLDADELPDPTLRAAIAKVARTAEPGAFQVAVVTRVGDRPLRWGPAARQWRLRLFPRGLGHWDVQDRVHEVAVVSAPLRRLEGQLWHFSFRDLSELRSRNLRYACVGAAARQGPPSRAKGATRAALAALRYLTLHGGLMLGKHGLAIASTLAAHTFLRWTLPGASPPAAKARPVGSSGGGGSHDPSLHPPHRQPPRTDT